MSNRPDSVSGADSRAARPHDANNPDAAHAHSRTQADIGLASKHGVVGHANALTQRSCDSKTAAHHLPAVVITGGANSELAISSAMHHGPRPEDNYRVQKVGDGKYQVIDSKPHEMLDSATVKPSRDRLLVDANRFMHGTYDTRFVADMVRFEDRSRDKLTQQQVVDTYRQVSRLLEQRSSMLGKDDMKRLARAVMLHAATPGSVDQGDHGTCAATAIESRMYSLHPADAVRLVADIATTGRYVAGDSTVVTLQKSTIRPDSEAQDYRYHVGVRSHATQIFNIVANNLNYANTSWRYESPKSGEVVKNYSFAPPQKLEFPGLNSAELVYVNDKILGKAEPDAMVSNTLRDSRHAGLKITSEQDLETTLADLKKKNRLPVMVEVDTSANPLWTDRGGGFGGGHVVTVTDYIPGNPAKVLVDNQWGAPHDHQYGAAVKLHDFYITTLPVDEALPVLEQDAQKDATAGIKNFSRDLDIARHHFWLGDITNRDLGVQVADIAAKMSKDWSAAFASKTLNRDNFNRDKAQLKLMIETELTEENRLPVFNKIRNASGFSATEVDKLVANSLQHLDRDYAQAPVHRAKILEEYRVLLDNLPESRRIQIASMRKHKSLA